MLRGPIATTLASLLLMTAVGAQEAGDLQLELNALQPSDAGCRVTFLATNNLGSTLTRSAFEVALFGSDGAIERMVSLDFKGMTAGKTKVLQFELQGLDCTKVTRVLVNDAAACEGESIEPGACLAQLTTSTRTQIAFGV